MNDHFSQSRTPPSPKRKRRDDFANASGYERKEWRWKLAAFSLTAALLVSGCWGPGGVKHLKNGSLSAIPPGGLGPVGPGGPTPPGPSGAPPGPVNLAGYSQLAEYQAADLSQKLAELQDENKSLLARLQGVQQIMEQRENAVVASRSAVQTATQEVAQARQELTRCRQEIAGLREHIRAADKENQANMQSLVNLLESMLEHGTQPTNATLKEKETGRKSTTKTAAEKH